MGSDLHHSGGPVGGQDAAAVEAADAGVAAVDVGTAVLAAENGPLGEDGKTVQGGGTGTAHHGICQDAVVEGHVDAVVVPVEGHGLHIDVGGQQLGAADPGVGAGVQNGLGAGG